MNRVVAVLMSWAIILVLGGCQGESRPSAVDASVSEPEFGLVYEFAWEDLPQDWESAKTLSNDVGYTIALTDAWVGLYRIQLAPCPESETRWWDPRGWISQAIAGHDDGVPDPSAFLDGAVEQIGADEIVTLPMVNLDTGRYCNVHVLYAETPEFALFQPGELNMVGKTVYLSGTWESEWTTGPTEFTLSTPLGNGALVPLEEPIELRVRGAKIRVIRQLDTLFDGMDFEGMSQDTLAKKFLLNIVNNTRVEQENLIPENSEGERSGASEVMTFP